MGDRKPQEKARYVIRVRGTLDPGWSKWFEGFSIVHHATGDTILAGEVVDRAAFYGVIGRARDLGLTVVSVERCDRLESSDE